MPGGRPSPIDAIIDTREDGTPVTVAERIVNALTTGNYFEFACASAGIGKETAYGWLRTGARTLLRTKGRPVTARNSTPHERRCIEFSDAVVEADARWVVQANTTLELLARGGIPQQTTTVKTDAQGQVLETTTKTSHTLPDAQVIMWRLTRRHPDLYGTKVELVKDRGALSPEDRARDLVSGIESFLADVDAAASVRSKGGGRRVGKVGDETS